MFVQPVVVASDLAKNRILAPNVGPLPQTQQLKLVEQSENIVIQPKQLKQLNSQNLKRQLEVVPSPADVCQADSNGYPAAHVPSKVPRWRRPPYLNICCTSSSTQQISPHMTKVNVMAKFNTVPDSALSEIEEYLDI